MQLQALGSALETAPRALTPGCGVAQCRAMSTAPPSLDTQSLSTDPSLTPEEVQWLRMRKLQDERSAWAWKVVKAYFPWIVSIGGTATSVIYWVVTHFTWKTP